MGPNSPSPHRNQAWPRVALLATLALGIAARMAQYLSNRSLWLDEAYLALNILGRDFSGLLRPLDNHQIAPPLFLWAVKLAVSLWGDGEAILRLVPLIGGILTLPLFYWLARRVLGPLGVIHPFFRSLIVLSSPWMNEEVRPAIQYIRDHWQEGDRVYVYHGAAPTFAYYAPRFGLDNPALCQMGRASNGDFAVLQDDVARLPPGRVWALFAHIYSFNGISERSFLLAQLDGRGTQLDRLEVQNAAVFLYDLR